MESKFELRRDLRRRRRALDAKQRQHAAQALTRTLAGHPSFRRAMRIACYLPADGEMDTRPLIEQAWRSGKQVFLPIVPSSAGRMSFRAYRPDSRLRNNRYGIPEPFDTPLLPPRALDLVLAPLVAFDAHGHRLGMGGGFYDRTFAFLHHRRLWQHPRLVGVAYAFQEVDELPAEPWDVPLWGIATEHGLRRFLRGQNNKEQH